jgi:hypothetical protein
MSYIDEFRSRWNLKNPLPLPTGRPIPGLAQGVLDSSFDIIGQYAAFIVVYYLDATVAQASLPAHLELQPSTGAPPGKHPAMCSFGFHQGVRPKYFHAWNYDYAEALVGIPRVLLRHGNGSTTGPYFYMTAVRLNNQFADDIGVALGFPKKMAIIQGDNTTYSIRMSANASPVMTGSFVASGGVFGPDYPNFQTIERLALQQPVISSPPVGGFLVTPFHIDTVSATMIPMRGEITIADNSLAGLPMGHYIFPDITAQPVGGGYYSIHNWEMGLSSPIDV